MHGPRLDEAPVKGGEAPGKSILVSLDSNISSFSISSFLLSCQSFSSAFFSSFVKLLKKVIRIGDTSCLLPIMDIFKDEDRKLMQTHCHFRALTILKNKQEDADLKEAIAYLSFAIIASGRVINILIGNAMYVFCTLYYMSSQSYFMSYAFLLYCGLKKTLLG